LLSIEEISKKIIDVPNFPKEGIIFKDITPVLLDTEAFSSMIELFKSSVDIEIDKIAAIESRGFILGAPLASAMGVGLVLVRKKGKLPRKTVSQSYGLEYGEDVLEIQEGDIEPGERVLIIDDVIATGGTASAAEELCLQLKANVVGFRFLMNIKALNGESKLKASMVSLMDV